MSRSKTGKETNARIQTFLDAFSMEHRDVRDLLANDLPYYNELLNLRAMSFRDFALMQTAVERGLSISDPFFSYDDVMPSCPICHTYQFVSRIDDNMYLCKKCSSKFAANKGSISSGTKCSALVWLKLLRCLIGFRGTEETCRICNIAPNTYFAIRNRLFYAMRIMMDQVRFYGEVQVDNTFIHTSYKGSNLTDDEYPEGSVFDQEQYLARSSRKRGGPVINQEKDRNSICIFTGIDDRGHVFARFAGIGSATGFRLTKAAPQNIYLSHVPKNDPFCFMRPQNYKIKQQVGSETILCSDKEPAIENYANRINFTCYLNVYRQKGKQLRLSKDEKNIQRVNNLHSKLKRFLQNSGYVSSRYLPGFLTLFEFVENTGVSEEAIKELFCIIAKPGFCTIPQKEFKHLFEIPQYYVQLLEEENPLKHINSNHLLAYYLYNLRRVMVADNAPQPITMKEITERTNLSAAYVRRVYKNLSLSGYGKLIEDFFKKTKLPDADFIPTTAEIDIVPPEMIVLFDTWNKERSLPYNKRRSLKMLTNDMNLQLGKNYSNQLVRYYFSRIVALHIRSPLQPIRKTEKMKCVLSSASSRKIGPTCKQRETVQIREEYFFLTLHHDDEIKMSRDEALDYLAQKYGNTKGGIINRMTEAIHIVELYPDAFQDLKYNTSLRGKTRKK